MGHELKIAGKTDKGKKRQNNEDFFMVTSELGLMIVADGMGGHNSGEVASRMAAQLCSEQMKRALKTGHVPVFNHVPKNPALDPRTLLLGDSIKFSNMAVYEAGHKSEANHNMGTTLVAALWLGDKLSVAHVGDSRLYVVRDQDLTLCTVDHSFVQEQLDKGLIKPEDAEKSDFRNMLTRSIGNNEDVDVDLREISLSPHDYILMCTDGLTKMLDDDQIQNVFNSISDPKAIADQLIDMSNQSGGKDNITVIVAQVQPSSLGSKVKGLFSKSGTSGGEK